MLKAEEVVKTVVEPVKKIEVKPIESVSQIVKQEIKLEHTENKEKQNEVEAGRIWGSVLLKVKEKNMFAFYSNIKNVYGVVAEDDKLILHINDKSIFEMIDTEEKKGVILSILKELNFNFTEVEIIYDETNKSKNDIIKSLKDTFLDKLKVKE